MDKNTVLGFVLIGAILIGFSVYNSKSYKEQVKERAKADSLARIEALKNMPADSSSSSEIIVSSGDSTSNNKSDAKIPEAIYKDSLLTAASTGKAETYTLENNKIRIAFTSKGAQFQSVLVKKYKTYDSLALHMVKKDLSNLDFSFFTNQLLNTSDFNFSLLNKTDTSLVFSLPFSGSAHMDIEYILPENSYMASCNVRMIGMKDLIGRSRTRMDIKWDLTIPRFEKGYDNEKNYSSVDYKYPNEKSVENIGRRKAEAQESIPTKIRWFAFQQQFFSAIMVSENNFNGGDLAYKFIPEEDPSGNLMSCSANMSVNFVYSDDINIPFSFYFGPNKFRTLKSYKKGFEKIVPLGGWLIGWINRVVIINCFDFLSRFIKNYGIIILIMTILLKLVISPFTFKSYLSTAKMKVLKPEIDKINAKYPKKEDAMKKQQATMDLYKKTGVNMFGGCLPMLFQFPILYAMFRFFPASFELRQQGFLWAHDLSAYDSIFHLPFRIPLYGDHVSLFALLMAVSMYFYSRINLQQMSSGQQMAGMKSMQLYFMPLFMLVLCNNFSSGLSYYYMLSNFITILQTLVIQKFFVNEEKLSAQLKAKAAKAKPKSKSRWQKKLEEMQRQQEAMRKNR
ncbi:MAG: membrane protein insertase YidC [Bacteroidales bacterium]|jgi:YidC/Oxa1 family membrane protein insertase|nr:membrane protein insertase YidC [Bacteroidales bacterium]